MSIKIYNGIKFKTRDISVILYTLYNLRKDALKVNNEYFYKFLPMYMYLSEKEKPYDIFRSLINSFDKKYRDTLDPDFLFEIFLYLHSSGDWYGYFIDDTGKCKKLLFDTGIVKDFHYQNQVDEPENVTEEEWKKREEVWEELLPGIGRLDDKGLLFKIVTENMIDISITIRQIKWIQNEDKGLHKC